MGLEELKNAVTRTTTALFEPAFDFVVVKAPRWDMDKFEPEIPAPASSSSPSSFSSTGAMLKLDRGIGPAMKSVGEAMGVGLTLCEALQKAMRGVHPRAQGFEAPSSSLSSASPTSLRRGEELTGRLRSPHVDRIVDVALALSQGVSEAAIRRLTGFSGWSVGEMSRCGIGLPPQDILSDMVWGEGGASRVKGEAWRRLKALGFADTQLAARLGIREEEVRAGRIGAGVVAVARHIDTVAAEEPTITSYLYLTHGGNARGDARLPEERDSPPDGGFKATVVVLGSGGYHIGSSVEFDCSGVMAVRALRMEGYRVVMLNMNPETVSTDFDEPHSLYLEPLSLESLLDVVDIEANRNRHFFDIEANRTTRTTNDNGDKPPTQLQEPYILAAFGGQRPNSVALRLGEAAERAPEGSFLRGVARRVLGTALADVATAESRGLHGALLESISIAQPAWITTPNRSEAAAWAVGRYPVLVRPSFILSGSGVTVVARPEELAWSWNQASKQGEIGEAITVTALAVDSYEVDVDAVAAGGKLVAYGISGHLEEAGVHSGDATLVMPSPFLSHKVRRKLKGVAGEIAAGLRVSGPFNVQCLVDKSTGDIRVIETNLRASRSLPFLSKALGIDFARLATAATLERLPLLEPVSPETIRAMHDAMLISDRAALGEGDASWRGVAVKVAAFSWKRVPGSEPRLGVEMRSTGEVAAFGPIQGLPEVYLEALESAGLQLPPTVPKEGLATPFVAAVLLPFASPTTRGDQAAREAATALGAEVELMLIPWRTEGEPCDTDSLLQGASWLVDLSHDPLAPLQGLGPKQASSCASELRRAAARRDLGLVLHRNQAILLAKGLAARREREQGLAPGEGFREWNHHQYLGHVRGAARAPGREL